VAAVVVVELCPRWRAMRECRHPPSARRLLDYLGRARPLPPSTSPTPWGRRTVAVCNQTSSAGGDRRLRSDSTGVSAGVAASAVSYIVHEKTILQRFHRILWYGKKMCFDIL